MIIANGSTDVTTYFVLRDSTNHAPKTDVTITDIDLYYVEELAAISSKADATALSAATDAHTDNYAFNIGQGLYRIDWPDTCFNGGGGKKCILIVVCSGVDTTFLEVELSPNVNTNSLTADVITAAGIADNAFSNEHFAAGALTSAEITSAAGCAVASIANDAITAAAIQNGAIDAATFAADVDAEIATMIWNAPTADYGGAGTYGQAVEDILADTNELQVDDMPTAVAAVKTVVDAVKVQTDKLAFTVANQVDANIQYINDTAVTGDGGATPWGPV